MRKFIAFFCFSIFISCASNAVHKDVVNDVVKKDSVSTVATSPASNNETQEERTARLARSVAMTIYDKGFSKVGNQNMTRFDISITNKSDQPITAVKGRFVVDNIFGDHLKNYNLKFDDTNIKPGQTIKITRFWDYNKTAKEDQKIKTTPLSKLKIDYEPEMVIYADGSTLQ